MFNLDDLKFSVGESSRKTSANTAHEAAHTIQGGSLATVLSQALVSEDKDQLDWVLSQSEESLIDRTLLQITEPKTISSLFSHVLIKFQEQSGVESLCLTMWLKKLLKIHWMSLLKTSPSILSKNLQSLSGLKQVIKSKTDNLHELLVLKGKLDMMEVTFQMQDPS